MFCSQCGEKNAAGAKFCSKCGTALAQSKAVVEAPAPRAAEGKRTSGFAIAALILGILGASLLAVVFGAIGISQTGKDSNLKGRGMAIAGLVLGILWIVGVIILTIAATFWTTSSWWWF
jgi:uncharacterized membrane protein YvbJ